MAQSAILILHNLRSAYNTGSLFRTADAAGISMIYLVGTTPAPIDRFGRAQQEIAKTALGAEKSVPWEYREDIHSLADELRKSEVQIIALEQAPEAANYREITPSGSFALIVGNEPDGLPQNVLETADVIAEIPMRGEKESLNVAVAAGIALFSLIG